MDQSPECVDAVDDSGHVLAVIQIRSDGIEDLYEDTYT